MFKLMLGVSSKTEYPLATAKMRFVPRSANKRLRDPG
jgi:hypothetical protein